jgi:hypothetical protein
LVCVGHDIAVEGTNHPLNVVLLRSFNEGEGDVVYDYTGGQHNGKLKGDFNRFESVSKALILPNVKKVWHDVHDPFLLDL